MTKKTIDSYVKREIPLLPSLCMALFFVVTDQQKIARYSYRMLMLFALLSIFLLCIPESPSAEVSHCKNILILHSYHKGYKWTDDTTAGFRSVLSLESNLDFKLHIEYMDTKTISDAEYLGNLFAVYKSKFNNVKFDLILSSDDAAYSFLLERGKVLFPGVPIVFCGVNYLDPQTLTQHSGITGVVEGYDIKKTIEVALHLHPETEEIFYITDATITGNAVMKEFRKTIGEYRDRLKFTKVKGQNLAELEKSVQGLPQDSILFMLVYFRDNDGNNYSYYEAVTALSKKSSVPIYGVWDFYLGHGIVGGRLTSGYYQGKTAAEQGLRIIHGESPAAVPIVIEETTQYAFDANKLEQYGIDIANLPPESEIINYSGNRKTEILVLNSYHKGMQWEDDIATGLQMVLNDRLDQLQISYDYMDTKRNSKPVYIQQVYQLLRTKYGTKNFDAIVAVDDAAFRFLTIEHDNLFMGTPVVFCGVNHYRKSWRENQSWFTGVVESYDIQATLSTVLKMQPEVKRVIVINDSTLTGQANQQNVKALEENFQNHLDFELWRDLNMADIQARVKNLPSDSIILLLSFNRDKSNNTYSYDDSIKLISSESAVPVYGIWDFYLGKGLLGGMLTSGKQQGIAAGEMLTKILDGTPPIELPVQLKSPNRFMFDLNVAKRYGIPEKLLPTDSILINDPFSLVEYYRKNWIPVLVGSSIVLLLISIILTLMVLLQNNTIRVRKRFETELERSRHDAEMANYAKGRFLANMSHEIRTPMNGLIGVTNLVLETDLDTVQRKYLEIVQTSGQSLLRVINDILDYSKIEAGKLKLAEESFELSQLLQEVVTLFENSANQKGITLKWYLAPALPQSVIGDSVRLRQVLCNLVGNAVKFTQDGSVSLEISCSDSQADKVAVHFAVMDTGIGIPKDQHELLFNDFIQLGEPGKRKEGGTGLGLSISRQLVELMGGVISLDSDAGKGSRFSFNIPMKVPSGLPSSEKTDLPKEIAGKRSGDILVAEDDQVSQLLMQLILEQRGYTVTVVSSGQEALKEFQKKHFDLIMLDINMPDLSGLEVTEAIRNHESVKGKTPIIAVSANAMKGDREKAIDAGMSDYITKPIEKSIVYRVLDQMLN